MADNSLASGLFKACHTVEYLSSANIRLTHHNDKKYFLSWWHFKVVLP